jgi:AcrR family transcriptional regulator
MKYDLTKKRTRGAQRTLDDFSTAMFHLIAEKSFDEINVNEICTLSNYPRATFYNYFDDKFDLLNYCWYVLSCEIKLDDFRELPKEQLLAIYLDRIYDLLSIKQKELDAILFNNGLSSSLTSSLRLYLQKRMREIFNVNIEACAPKIRGRIPLKLLADHFSNTLLLILEWIFFKRNKISKQEAHAYLAYLLENF